MKKLILLIIVLVLASCNKEKSDALNYLESHVDGSKFDIIEMESFDSIPTPIRIFTRTDVPDSLLRYAGMYFDINVPEFYPDDKHLFERRKAIKIKYKVDGKIVNDYLFYNANKKEIGHSFSGMRKQLMIIMNIQ